MLSKINSRHGDSVKENVADIFKRVGNSALRPGEPDILFASSYSQVAYAQVGPLGGALCSVRYLTLA